MVLTDLVWNQNDGLMLPQSFVGVIIHGNSGEAEVILLTAEDFRKRSLKLRAHSWLQDIGYLLALIVGSIAWVTPRVLKGVDYSFLCKILKIKTISPSVFEGLNLEPHKSSVGLREFNWPEAANEGHCRPPEPVFCEARGYPT